MNFIVEKEPKQSQKRVNDEPRRSENPGSILKQYEMMKSYIPETFEVYLQKRRQLDNYLNNHAKWEEFKDHAEPLYDFVETRYGFTEIVQKVTSGKNFGSTQEEKDAVADYWETISDIKKIEFADMKKYTIFMEENYGSDFNRWAYRSSHPILPDLDLDGFTKAGFSSYECSIILGVTQDEYRGRFSWENFPDPKLFGRNKNGGVMFQLKTEIKEGRGLHAINSEVTRSGTSFWDYNFFRDFWYEMSKKARSLKLRQDSAKKKLIKRQNKVLEALPVIKDAKNNGCKSLREFANFFEVSGLKTTTGKNKWYPSAVQKILDQAELAQD